MRTEIPLLQNVRVASPCSADWNAMTPVDGERVRFCDGCQKRVYNLSALGQAEAEGLLRQHEGRLCVRYYRRTDGTILTTDCPVGLRAARQLVLKRQTVSLAMCSLLCLAFAAWKVAGQEKQTSDVVGGIPAVQAPLMGDIDPSPHPDAKPTPKSEPQDTITIRATVGSVALDVSTLKSRLKELSESKESGGKYRGGRTVNDLKPPEPKDEAKE